MPTLNALLEMSSAKHSHLCPRQVLGVSMGMCAACSQCGEEIFNERETRIENHILCRSCAGQVCYASLMNIALDRYVFQSMVEG